MINARGLQNYADAARLLLASQPIVQKTLPDPARLANACTTLRLGLLAARNAGAFANPWTIAGLGRREVRNCAVLARLWNPAITGIAGRSFLEATLRLTDPEGLRGIPVSDIAHRQYAVFCESCLAGDGANRLDIVVESVGGDAGWTIVFEAKIGAGLGDNQLERYSEVLKTRKAFTRRDTYLVYLSPRPLDEVGEKGMHLRWRDVAQAARQFTKQCQTNASEPERLIAAFGDHVADFDN